MQTGFFEKQIVLTPDLCGSAAALSPLAAFTIFQGVASEHAEKIGVGGAAMAKRGEFWLTVHSRVDFYGPAYLMDELTARTWPERCEGRDIRCFRSYRLTHGEKTVALGRTQWAILGPEGKILRFEQSGFPADFPFPETAAIDEPPVRFHDELTQDELSAYLNDSAVQKSRSNRFDSSYLLCKEKDGSTIVVWYESEADIAEKTELCKLLGIKTVYVLK